jgi:PLP dependent protein
MSTGHDARERRRADLVTALGAVRTRIAEACAASGRHPREITLIAVTKTRPASDVAALADIGVADIGENKDQEARAKISELAGPGYPPLSLRWHLIGQLQTNKARSVAGYAEAVHSVDRPRLATALNEAAGRVRESPLPVFLQISLDGDPERGGVPVDALAGLADQVAGAEHLRLRGVMAVPPMGSDADREFARLAELAAQVHAAHPGADSISAGMSADLEAAIRHGSTHVRVGSALLGRREQVFG